jgi:Cys-tRNA(Pro)/Cys-tRNA(Cys) deacylase
MTSRSGRRRQSVLFDAAVVVSYEHDPKSDSYGLEAADKLSLDAARVFKTIVVNTHGRLGIAIVPVTTELDLKALGKRPAMADHRAAERATATSSAASRHSA